MKRKPSRHLCLHMIFAFDKHRRCIETLSRHGPGNTLEEIQRINDDYDFYAKWRNDEMLAATGMTWDQFHDYALTSKR